MGVSDEIFDLYAAAAEAAASSTNSAQDDESSNRTLRHKPRKANLLDDRTRNMYGAISTVKDNDRIQKLRMKEQEPLTPISTAESPIYNQNAKMGIRAVSDPLIWSSNSNASPSIANGLTKSMESWMPSSGACETKSTERTEMEADDNSSDNNDDANASLSSTGSRKNNNMTTNGRYYRSTSLDSLGNDYDDMEDFRKDTSELRTEHPVFEPAFRQRRNLRKETAVRSNANESKAKAKSPISHSTPSTNSSSPERELLHVLNTAKEVCDHDPLMILLSRVVTDAMSVYTLCSNHSERTTAIERLYASLADVISFYGDSAEIQRIYNRSNDAPANNIDNKPYDELRRSPTYSRHASASSYNGHIPSNGSEYMYRHESDVRLPPFPHSVSSSYVPSAPDLDVPRYRGRTPAIANDGTTINDIPRYSRSINGSVTGSNTSVHSAPERFSLDLANRSFNDTADSFLLAGTPNRNAGLYNSSPAGATSSRLLMPRDLASRSTYSRAGRESSLGRTFLDSRLDLARSDANQRNRRFSFGR